MPLVTAYIPPNHYAASVVDQVFFACSEVVPAALNAPPLGRLTPGSIEFIPVAVPKERYTGGSIVIDIEAYHYDDRAENLEERSQQIRLALKELCGVGPNFKVWCKLVYAGWSSESGDPDFDGDMSMPAAIQRAAQLITANL